MRTREDVIRACMGFADAFEDYPFDDPGWTAMRHISNRKTFAFICERLGNIWINLKCEPLKGDFLKDAYPSVLPAYHMNKTHWISVVLDGSMTEDEVMAIIEDSYLLTLDRKKRK